MKPHLITHAGKTQSMRAWSRETGIDYETLKTRIHSGWAIGRALTEPVSPKQRKGHPWKRYVWVNTKSTGGAA